MNKYNNKHLSLANRITIEKCISDGFRKFETAKEINKSPATVGKEILKNRKTRARDSFNTNTNTNQCIYIKDCGICNFKCRDYKENKYYRRDRFVGTCNNCPEIKKCKLTKYYYSSKQANYNYLYNLKDSREGVNLTTTELLSIIRIIKPLIKQGQSIYTILENHKEISLSTKTLYTYIEIGFFNDWGINNLSLKRKVRRKIKSKKLKKISEPADYSGRKFEDYQEFIKCNPHISTTKMDTIYNSHSGPFIQTFIFQNYI